MLPPWQHSRHEQKSQAKKLLREEIMAKVVTADSDPKVVHESQPLYNKYPLTNFKTNLKNLIKACENPKQPLHHQNGRKALPKNYFLKTSLLAESQLTWILKLSSKVNQNFSFTSSVISKLIWPIYLEAVLKDYDRLQDDCDAYGHDLAVLKEIA
jgi:hypothetical protein